MKESKVELTENRLILSQIYFTLLYSSTLSLNLARPLDLFSFSSHSLSLFLSAPPVVLTIGLSLISLSPLVSSWLPTLLMMSKPRSPYPSFSSLSFWYGLVNLILWYGFDLIPWWIWFCGMSLTWFLGQNFPLFFSFFFLSLIN